MGYKKHTEPAPIVSDDKKIDLEKRDKFYNSFFYVGWRPTLFWIITASIAYAFLIRPMVATIMICLGIQYSTFEIDTGSLVTLVTLAMGSVGVRAYEKGR